MSRSQSAVLFSIIFILGVHLLYETSWKRETIFATLTWDVNGYYSYLPSAFIYKDLKTCESRHEIFKKYRPNIQFDAAFVHEASGNYVMKYPMGQAVQFAPFFAIAHLWASNSSVYPADGYSFPYQLLISLGALLLTIIGLLFLRKVLIIYFGETETALAILIIAIGTNYLSYTAIKGAMTHNNLFSICALLIYLSILFYRRPSNIKALFIGLLLGLAALTRPTEIIMCLIPLCWGINVFSKTSRKERLQFFKTHQSKMLLAVLTCLAVGSLQLFYWKWASGDWIVYSYQDQGFSWLKPHLKKGFFSYRAGWFIYTPVMIFALIGFLFLKRYAKSIFFICALYVALHIYITFAWDIWWYGGSLGQRAMIQAYPVLAFPLAACMKRLQRANYLKWLAGIAILFFTYLNLWYTHQAHHGGLLHAGQMTKAYFWKTIGTYERNPEHLKLLDTNQFFDGERLDVKQIVVLDEQNANTPVRSEDLNSLSKYVQGLYFSVPLTSEDDFDWIRVSARFHCEAKEWNLYKMAQLAVRFDLKGVQKRTKFIRLHRLIDHKETKKLFLDVKKTDQEFDNVRVVLWNGSGTKTMNFDNLRVETFSE